MARTYVERLQHVNAAQNTGDNLTELEEFALGQITVKEGKVVLTTTSTPPLDVVVETTDWLIDDKVIGFISVMTNEAFSVRFNVQAVAKPAPEAE